MAKTKFSQFTENNTPALTDEVVGLQGGVNMRASLQAIKDLYDANAIVSLTYAEAQTLVSASGLNAGGLYLITDATDGNIELMLTAATTSAFSTNAVNPIYPERTVVYDFERDLILNSVDQTEAVGLSNYPTGLYEWVVKNASTTTVSARDGAGMVKMRPSPNEPYRAYLMGGWDPVYDPINITNNEVYLFSEDFTSTTRQADAGWSKRHTFNVANEENKCWVWASDIQGGMPGQVECWEGIQNPDLTITWTLKNADCGWGARFLTGGCRHNGSLYLMGGQTDIINNDNPKTDVWRSDDDGTTWTQIAIGLDFLGMNLSRCVVSYNGYIYIVSGGEYKTPTTSGTALNTVYRSIDGITWEQMPNAPFVGRQYADVIVHENKLFVLFGGRLAAPQNLYDCWTMDAFGNWEQIPISGPESRHAAAAVSINNVLLMATGNYWNDTWALQHVQSGSLVNTIYDQTIEGIKRFEDVVDARVGISIGTESAPGITTHTLSEYAQGTWTPAAGSGVNLIDPEGRWTRIGRTVFCHFNIKFPVTASGATATISGLPFNARTGNRNGAIIGLTDYTSAFTLTASGGIMTFYNTSAVGLTYSALSNKGFLGLIIYEINI